MAKKVFSVFFILSIFLFPPAPARSEAALVQRIESYINGITHMQGDFIQQGPGEAAAKGKFWLRRPWRIRFAYAHPNKNLIIADGVWLSMQADPGQPPQRYPLGATPARFILAPNLRITQEAKILEVAQNQSRIHLWLSSRDSNLPGRIQLRFRQNPMTLEGWTIIDAQGMTTKIILKKVKRGIRASNKLFFVEDATFFKKRR